MNPIFPPSPLERAKQLHDWHKQCRDAEGDNDPRNEGRRQ